MARNLAALRAALGGLAGAAAGFSAQKAAEEERARQQRAEELQRGQVLASLLSSGWQMGAGEQAVPRPMEAPTVRQLPKMSLLPSEAQPEIKPSRDLFGTTAPGSPFAVGRPAVASALQAGTAASPLTGGERPASILTTPVSVGRPDVSSILDKVAAQPSAPSPRSARMVDFGGGMVMSLPKTATELADDRAAQARALAEADRAEAERKAAQQKSAEEDARAKALMRIGKTADGKPLTYEVALEFVRGGASPKDLIDTGVLQVPAKPMTQAEENRYKIDLARLGLDRERLDLARGEAREKTRTQEEKRNESLKQLRGQLPTIARFSEEANRILTDKAIEKLDGNAVYWAVLATKGDPATQIIANKLTTPQGRLIARYIRTATDAVARASEVGVLTHQDITRYESQLTPIVGDDRATIAAKMNTLREWMQWLASNQEALKTGNPRASTRAPDESEEEYLRRTGRPDIRSL